MSGWKNLHVGRLNGKQRNQLKGLLDMEYRPRELAYELGIDQNQIYIVYLPLGCPCRRDERTNHIWINGAAFRDWYEGKYKMGEPEEGEVYCISCKTYQVMNNPTGMRMENGTVYNLYKCPNCGKQVANIIGRVED